MPQTKPQLDVGKILASMGYGYLFKDPFSGDYTRDPKNTYKSAWDAYDRMLAWDPELAALDKLARLAVLAHDTEIVPATDDAESKKAADFCIEMISNIPYWEDILYDLLDAPAKGMAVIQKGWVRDGSRMVVADSENGPALQTLPQHWFYWKLIESKPTLVYRGLYGGQKDEPLDPENFIIARWAYSVENPYGRGYLTEAFWTFVTKKIVKGFMVQLVQRGVELERWVQCAADELGKKAWDMRDVIRNTMGDFARRSDMVLPPGVDLNYQPGDTGALASELNFIYLLDNYLAKLVLGQTLTTEQGRTGTYSQAVIHELQQARGTITRCKDQMADVNDQLITPVCELNFNIGRAKWRRKYEPEDDRTDQAKRLAILANKYDLELPKGWLHHAQGLPEPENPEEVYIPKRGGGGGGFGMAATEKKNLTALAAQGDSKLKLIDRQVARHVDLAKGTVNKRLKLWKTLIEKSKSYEDLTARLEAREREWPELAELLRKGTVASYALGFASQATQTKISAAITAPPVYDTWEDVLEKFKDKVPVDAETFYNLDMELRPKYFATAIAEDEYMATVLHSGMTAAIEEGQTFSTFKIGAYDAMRAAGYEFPEPYRLLTVFRRHLHTADAAARDEWYSIPEVDEMIWGFEYLTSGRPNVRPSHARLNHTKLPKDHYFWATNTPPNAYG